MTCYVRTADDTTGSATVFWKLNGRRISDLIEEKTFDRGSFEGYQTPLALGATKEIITSSLTVNVLSFAQKGWYSCEVETEQGKTWPSFNYKKLDIIKSGKYRLGIIWGLVPNFETR